MKFFGDIHDFLGTLGPPTDPQPQWTGVGYKSFVFSHSPVVHAITPDNRHHQFIEVDPHNANLPVERALLGYIKDAGYNPYQFDIPEHQTAWNAISEQFGFPDSRPASTGQALPAVANPPPSRRAAPGPDLQPRVRDASEASLPRKPRF